VDLMNGSFRCITAHSALDHAALCCKAPWAMQASQTVFGMGRARLL